MTIQEVLLTDDLRAEGVPVYDKDPGRAYVIDGACFTEPFRKEEARPVGEHVVESTLPHRVHVPMAPITELQKSPDDLVFDLVRRVAELGNWVDYEGNFDNIRAYFTSVDFPWSTVVMHPTLGIQVPHDVKVIDHASMSPDRFYCLTVPEHLGRIPTQHEQKGFLIFNPRGVLTAFV
jgi:hypothetical protein